MNYVSFAYENDGSGLYMGYAFLAQGAYRSEESGAFVINKQVFGAYGVDLALEIDKMKFRT